MVNETIEQFIFELSHLPAQSGLFNPYAPNGTQTANLRRYLHHMQSIQPAVLLIGEALGYRGGRLTGIPFTSPALLQSHSFFSGYKSDQAVSEATATMVWDCFETIRFVPLCWNAVPLHPFRVGKEQSNRAPTLAEIDRYSPFINRLLGLFSIKCVVAVGNRAEQALTRLQISHKKVRHPSYGGKQAFSDGLHYIIEAL